MNEDFERRVRCAGVAGWWTLLVTAIVLLLQWILYLLITTSQPAWFLSLWGSGFSWQYIQNVWLLAIVFFKALLLVIAMLSLWLTLWARQLRKK